MAIRDNPYRVVSRHTGEIQMRFVSLASAKTWLRLCDHEESDFRPSDAQVEQWDGKHWLPIAADRALGEMSQAEIAALGIACQLSPRSDTPPAPRSTRQAPKG